MRLLLAVDGSPHSQLAVAAVAERPWPDGTIVEVLAVIHAVAPLAIDPAFVMAAAHVDQIARLVLGSVGGAVVANAPCSVHVAREKHDVDHAAA